MIVVKEGREALSGGGRQREEGRGGDPSTRTPGPLGNNSRVCPVGVRLSVGTVHPIGWRS